MATCDTNELLSSASCFSCIPRGQLYILKLVLLSKILEQKGGGRPTVQELLDYAACFSCLTSVQLQILKIQLLCSILGGNVNYANEIPSDASITDGDPVLLSTLVADELGLDPPPSDESYSLVGTSPVVGTNHLEWTTPPSIDPSITNLIQSLYLQRSATADNMPNPNAWPDLITPNSPTAPVYNVNRNPPALNPTGPYPDPNWSTIRFWPQSELLTTPLPSSYDDNVGTSTYYAYRLVMMLRSSTHGDPPYEMDWNVVVMCQPYKLCFNDLATCPTTIPQGSRTLVWNAPTF